MFAITSAIALFILVLVVLSSIPTRPNEKIGVTPLPDQEQSNKTTDQGREQLVSEGDFNIDWLLHTSRNNITEAVPTSQQPMKGLKENTEGKLECTDETVDSTQLITEDFTNNPSPKDFDRLTSNWYTTHTHPTFATWLAEMTKPTEPPRSSALIKNMKKVAEQNSKIEKYKTNWINHVTRKVIRERNIKVDSK